VKIYSNVLNDHDIWQAINAASQASTDAGHGHVGAERFRDIRNPRVRRHGWDLLLYRAGSRRHFNTGTYGAGDQGAASWDDYGWFIAVLFERDPGARIGHYTGRENFHAATRDKYLSMSGTGERGTLSYMESGTPRVLLAECGTCERGWNDALVTAVTPTPAARCPYEYEHGNMGVPDENMSISS
jgi:hypothetical protein